MRFIIETHSEAILNSVGIEIERKNLDKDKANIVLFNAAEEGYENYIEEAQYNERGFVEHWPTGFYQKMFIKVERDIIDVILRQQRDKKRERAIDVLVQLMTASRSNHHKVYLKCLLEKEDEKILQAALDENSWREFCRLQRDRIDVEGLVAMLDVYAVITCSKHCSRVGKELQINPLEDSGFSWMLPPTYVQKTKEMVSSIRLFAIIIFLKKGY